ncbi:unnamed protein product [Vitrella brassicaformis CCMP3155]|uniref:Peptidase S58 DmpA n=1 Tax=Vitrella brassicaformis (strain CCMP3155) TaxID=1169540 RepID=A0A0G4EEV2_VITBC|nr:unnamed protein product [Vitrella brassicaformis CCMP3155]|eukprot:CEL94541.1 unnamed protein product [Vitrella brassicaformis CCMP3155]
MRLEWLDRCVSVGQHTDEDKQTGATAFIFHRPMQGALVLCGSAPASREALALQPGCSVSGLHGLLFAGGSAFGLDSCAGLLRWQREHQRGVSTVGGVVPVCPAACIYDLNSGTPEPPTADDVYNACGASSPYSSMCEGAVGAGTGARVGKKGPKGFVADRGGLGVMSMSGPGDIQVSACVVVNAFGDILDEKGDVLAGGRVSSQPVNVASFILQEMPPEDSSAASFDFALDQPAANPSGAGDETLHTCTTLGVVFTNVDLDRNALLRIGKMATAGFARSICPAFTPFDGDIIYTFSTATCKASRLSAPDTETIVGQLAAACMCGAIRRAVRLANDIK